MSDTPKPDEFGRYRIQQDTGTKFSASREPLDGEKVLSEPASDPLTGEALPPDYPPPKPLSSTTTSGQSAESMKEQSNG